MASTNSSRIKKMQAAAIQHYKAHTASLDNEAFREHSRRVLRGVTPVAAAQEMREYGFTEEMIDKSLKYIYEGEDTIVHHPRR